MYLHKIPLVEIDPTIYNYALCAQKTCVRKLKNSSQTTVHCELDKSSVCENENEPRDVNGPVVVKLTTFRFTGTVSTKTRNSLVAYLRTQYVPPWDSFPHPENYT